MIIDLFQPVKSAKLLGSLRGVIVIAAILLWHWFKNKAKGIILGGSLSGGEPNFVIKFNGSDGSLGYYRRRDEWRQIAKVKLIPSKVQKNLHTVTFSLETCEELATVLSCGCQRTVRFSTENLPREQTDPKCEECGKYHYAKGDAGWENSNCEEHTAIYQQWPQLDQEKFDPETRIDDLDACSALVKGVRESTLTSKEREGLCQLIAKIARGSGAYFALRDVAGFELEPKCCDALAVKIRNPRWASRILNEHHDGKLRLGAVGLSHLRRVRLFGVIMPWAIRLATLATALHAWLWHLPDWRTVVVLATTAACVMIAVKIKEWLG